LRLPHGQWLDSQPLPPAGVLLVAEATTVDTAALTDWVEAGGHLVVTAAVETLGELADVDTAPHDEGLVDFADGWAQRPARALRALGGHGLTGRSAEVEVLASWVDGPAAITRTRRGAGTVTVFGVDLWRTVVRILQGYPVLEDHAPAADGSAPMDEGVLK